MSFPTRGQDKKPITTNVNRRFMEMRKNPSVRKRYVADVKNVRVAALSQVQPSHKMSSTQAVVPRSVIAYSLKNVRVLRAPPPQGVVLKSTTTTTMTKKTTSRDTTTTTTSTKGKLTGEIKNVPTNREEAVAYLNRYNLESLRGLHLKLYGKGGTGLKKEPLINKILDPSVALLLRKQ